MHPWHSTEADVPVLNPYPSASRLHDAIVSGTQGRFLLSESLSQE